ncbi:MAG: GNAT family N-acetyltransferase [Nocardioides sp.]|nr:GNAT family N-acetyltransferase [Nocardioides sp.]
MFREATTADAAALCDLERAASQAALGHVFAPDRHPFPEDDVLTRWALVLQEPGARVLLADGIALVAHDLTTLRHLAVHPDHWGEGWGRRGVEVAVAALRVAGTDHPTLWCLEENSRARGLYEHLGWEPTGATQEAAWPPYPTEMEYRLRG